MITLGQLLTYATVCQLFDCSKRTLKRMIAEGELAPPVVSRSGRTRFRSEDVLRCYLTIFLPGPSTAPPPAPVAPPPPPPRPPRGRTPGPQNAASSEHSSP